MNSSICLTLAIHLRLLLLTVVVQTLLRHARLVHGIRLNSNLYSEYIIVIKEELLATYGEEVRGAETTAAYQKTEQQPGKRRFYLNSVSLPLLMGNSDPV